jgi:hypothetical protein
VMKFASSCSVICVGWLQDKYIKVIYETLFRVRSHMFRSASVYTKGYWVNFDQGDPIEIKMARLH